MVKVEQPVVEEEPIKNIDGRMGQWCIFQYWGQFEPSLYFNFIILHCVNNILLFVLLSCREIKSTVELLEERLKKLGIKDSYALQTDPNFHNPIELTSEQGMFLKVSFARHINQVYYICIHNTIIELYIKFSACHCWSILSKLLSSKAPWIETIWKGYEQGS